MVAFAKTASSACLAAALLCGCSGHQGRTLKMRTALDAGNPREAIHSLNEELSVKSDKELPSDLQGDNALLVLDRASIQQSLAQFDASKKDFEAADKAIDMLDLARNAGDSIGQYVFSDSAGKYSAPPYEKLLINTLNLLNYLELGDLNGARVEARRLSVIARYFREQLKETDNRVLGLGSFLAGFTYEKSGEYDEALRYYDDALALGIQSSLRDPLRVLAGQSSYDSPRIRRMLEGQPPLAATEQTGEGEIVLVAGYGRVPNKIAQRIPIGLALTYVAGSIHPEDAAAANHLAAQGLVTWVNFPTLAPHTGAPETPQVTVDGRSVALPDEVDVSAQVRAQWKKLEGKIILSAITRLVSRLAVGEGVRRATEKQGGVFSILAALGAQAALTALDTPDTRSWETLPARIAVTRLRVPAGRHTVVLSGRGVTRKIDATVTKGGWSVISLQALR